MHARVTGAKYNGPSLSVWRAAATISTDALRIGLAHFIHEINTPLQTVYWAADVMDTHMPKANGSGDPFAGKIFQELKGGVDQLVSLVSSLESQLKSLWMIDPCFDSVNLNSLIVEVIQSDAARFDAGGIRVDSDIAAALPALTSRCKTAQPGVRQSFPQCCGCHAGGGSLECQCRCARGLGVARNR